MITSTPVPDEVQETLDRLTDQAAAESFNEVVKVLSTNAPTENEEFKSSFRSCTWWDEDYYCQDENWRWHLIDLSSR